MDTGKSLRKTGISPNWEIPSCPHNALLEILSRNHARVVPDGFLRDLPVSIKEKRAKTVSERIFHAWENPRVFVSTDLIFLQELRQYNCDTLLFFSIDYFQDPFSNFKMGLGCFI